MRLVSTLEALYYPVASAVFVTGVCLLVNLQKPAGDLLKTSATCKPILAREGETVVGSKNRA